MAGDSNLFNQKVWVPCTHGIWRLADVKSCSDTHLIVYHKQKKKDETKIINQKLPLESLIEEKEENEEKDIEQAFDQEEEEKEVHDIDDEHQCYELAKSSVHPWDPSHEELNTLDVSKLSMLNEGALMHIMQNRLQADCIYTMCGEVLISVNPFKSINRLYDIFLFSSFLKSENLRRAFHHDKNLKFFLSNMNILGLNCSKETISHYMSQLQHKKGIPHIYTIAQRAKDYLIRPIDTYGREVFTNQSIIISGESGAGKTEASKHIMKYLCFSTVHHSEEKGLISGVSGSGMEDSSTQSQSLRKRSMRRTNQTRSSLTKKHNDPFCSSMIPVPTLMMTSWEECIDETTGELYYYDPITDTKTWEEPPELTAYKQHQSLEKERSERLEKIGKNHSNQINALNNKSVEEDEEVKHADLVDCLLVSNNILESFGNAKTVRNDNSSRFGKYIQLIYDTSDNLVGAQTNTFLLEKSRLSSVALNERNYHIFYMLVEGAEKDTKDNLKLDLDKQGTSKYRILKSGECLNVTGRNEISEFNSLIKAFEITGFSKEEVANLFTILAAILHLSQLSFHFDGDENSLYEKPVEIIEEPGISLKWLASLLCIEDIERFREVILHKFTSSIRGESMKIPLTVENVQNNISALIKYMYGQLFSWLVQKINFAHRIVPLESESSLELQQTKFIGILDIFGFEIMETNSFEQLCINFANEALQQQFNNQVFENEKIEYESEEIDFSMIHYKNNQDVIDLINKKPTGLFPTLEDIGKFARKPDNQALLTQYNKNHGNGKIACYTEPKFKSNNFIVKHFAGEVVYCVEGFLEKNDDSLHESLLQCIKSSNLPFLTNVIGDSPIPDTPGYIEPNGYETMDKLDSSSSSGNSMSPRSPTSSSRNGIASAHSVSSKFRKQLNELIQNLNSTEPHYVKCIKPNSKKAANTFENKIVVQQLRYSGVLEVVRIRRQGYPIRMTHSQFYKKFQILLTKSSFIDSNFVNNPANCKKECERLRALVVYPDSTEKYARKSSLLNHNLQSSSEKECLQIGTRKVFLREETLALLENSVLLMLQENAVKIQSLWKCALANARYDNLRFWALLHQTLVRKFLCSLKYKRQKQATLAIQIWFRYRTQLWEKKQQKSATQIQALMKSFIQKRKFQKRKSSVLLAICKITTNYRRFIYRRIYVKKRLQIILVQAYIRAYFARKKHSSIKTKLRLQRERENKKATKLQTFFRSKLASRRYQLCLKKVIVLQRNWRLYFRKKTLKNLNEELHFSIYNAHIEDAIAILEQNPELLNMRNTVRDKMSLYHTCAQTGNMMLMRILDPEPIDLTLTDVKGRTALHFAASGGHYKMIKVFEVMISSLSKERLQEIICNAQLFLMEYSTFDSVTLHKDSSINLNSNHQIRSGTERTLQGKSSSTSQINPANILHEGWLLKQAKSWMGILKQKRYCMVTSLGEFIYSKQENYNIHDANNSSTNIVKLDLSKANVHLVGEKADHAFVIDFHSEPISNETSVLDRSYIFYTSSSTEVYKWLSIVQSQCTHSNAFANRLSISGLNLPFLNGPSRSYMANLKDKNGRTPLHATCIGPSISNYNSYSAEELAKIEESSFSLNFELSKNPHEIEDVDFCISIITLLENGANVNERDNYGNTPLHYALALKRLELAKVLIEHGADINCPNNEDKKPSDLGEDISQFSMSKPSKPCLSPPHHAVRSHYITFNLEKISLDTDYIPKFSPVSSDKVNVGVLFSIYSPKRKLVESQQELWSSFQIEEASFYVGRRFYMQTPIEILPEGSFCVIEVIVKENKKLNPSSRKKDNTITASWGYINLDVDSLESTTFIEMLKPPVDLKLLRCKAFKCSLDFELMVDGKYDNQEVLNAEKESSGTISYHLSSLAHEKTIRQNEEWGEQEYFEEEYYDEEEIGTTYNDEEMAEMMDIGSIYDSEISEFSMNKSDLNR